MGRLHFVVTLFVVLLSTRAVLAQESDIPATTDFSLGVGYASISVGDGELDNEGAWKFDPSLTFSIVPGLPQLRAGFAVPFALVLDNSQRTIISNGGSLVVIGSSDLPLWFIEPEARLSWRQYIGDASEFFIEPGVAAGWTYGYLDLDDDPDSPGSNSYSEGDSTWHTRVFLRVGARMEGGFGGIEAAWMRGGDLDFADNAQGDLEEFYIGVFGQLTF